MSLQQPTATQCRAFNSRFRFALWTFVLLSLLSSSPTAAVRGMSMRSMVAVGDASGNGDATQYSNNVSLSVGCPDFLASFYAVNVSSSAQPFRTFTLTKGTAYAYFSIHFAKLWVPLGGSILLRGVEDYNTPDVVVNLTNSFPNGTLYENVSTPILKAKELRIEVYREFPSQSSSTALSSLSLSASIDTSHCYGFVVDGYNYQLVDRAKNITPAAEATCAQDNTAEAICYFPTQPTAYLASRAVARLLIQKSSGQSSACTGWLLGSEGHLITNNHCVKDDIEARSMTVEFMADASTCATNCMLWGACEGTVEAIGASVVYTSADLDYTILKLNSNVDLPEKYGFLRLKALQGHVGQQIYIPQHPLYYGKRIAMFDDFHNQLSIMDTNATGCDKLGYSYTGDTDGGSSGSPVIDLDDHGVVALHRCGQYCANTGVPSVKILSDLQANNKLPKDAVDMGDPKDNNTAKFPSFTPQEAATPLTLTTQLTLDGAIRVLPNTSNGGGGGTTVSIDQIEFTLANDADVEIDVLSVEISDDGLYFDVNGDCTAQYMDPIMYLFVKGDAHVVKIADDTDPDLGKVDGSVSYRDPYLRTFLKKGTYILSIGSVPLKDSDAYSGVTNTTVIDQLQQQQRTPELYVCTSRGSSVGAYRVTMRSSDHLSFGSMPKNVSIPSTPCAMRPEAICAPLVYT